MSRRRVLPSRASWEGVVLMLAGCATASPTETPKPLPTEEVAPTLAAAETRQPEARTDAARISRPEELETLCMALRDESSMTFPGNAVDQARAVEAHAQNRQTAKAARYVATIPAAGFAFRTYEIGDRRLVLETAHGFALGDGAELLLPSKDPSLGFALSPDSADRILVLRTAGKLGLQLVFRPANPELRSDNCMWLGGGRVVRMEIELLDSALVGPDDTVLARGDTGDPSDSPIATPVRSPRVSVGKVRTADGREVPTDTVPILATLADKARPCYEQTLSVRPSLRGTLVLDIHVGTSGRIETAHVEMSSLGDDALASCVAKAAAKTTLSGASPGQRLSVPLQLGSAED